MKRIHPSEAKTRLENEKGIYLVDVRETYEYASGHIQNAMLIPLGTIKAQAASKIPDKNATIFVYCKSGMRSSQAQAILVNMGYTNVFNMGGIMSWPYEVVS